MKKFFAMVLALFFMAATSNVILAQDTGGSTGKTTKSHKAKKHKKGKKPAADAGSTAAPASK